MLARTDPLQVCVVVSPRNNAPTRRSGITVSAPACDNGLTTTGGLVAGAVMGPADPAPAVRVTGPVHAAAKAVIVAAAPVSFTIRVTCIITILPDRRDYRRNADPTPVRSHAEAGRNEPLARVCGTLDGTVVGRHRVLPQRGDEAR
ncbi:hypothetical protein MBOE_48470 [Mycolicibacterium boenickei]|uniref:Uncharacterized protein n=1 Tax=Mycolicibacterium boenickei TaxID=146017 RepID=A0ABM7J208_9MYCO|nr:hypothetical protein MBOE_48470 [Mycolicibacterium boenickei]